jgi:hypothetical protein
MRAGTPYASPPTCSVPVISFGALAVSSSQGASVLRAPAPQAYRPGLITGPGHISCLLNRCDHGMKDYAREENGGQVVMASCGDERFPPENMLDGKDNTYWVTTGMFPQEFVLKLDSCIRVSKITTLSMNGELHLAG